MEYYYPTMIAKVYVVREITENHYILEGFGGVSFGVFDSPISITPSIVLEQCEIL